MTLWTSAEAAEATGGTVTCDWVANGVSIDTRTIQPGDLFVALKAARDGHDFVANALAAGAGAALVTHIPEGVDENAPLLIVADVLEALEAMGRHARARTSARVAAITGSVGKTSTKEMLRAALAGQGNIHVAEASYNNHWGVPLTLARMPANTDYAVLEMGMSNPGEIAPLSNMGKPHVAMVTTVAAAHLEAFEGLDGIAREKGSICQGLEPGGVAVLNGDLPTSDILRDAANGFDIQTFGQNAANDWRLDNIAITPGQTTAQGQGPNGAFDLLISTEGAHFAVNAIGALAVAQALGADFDAALAGIANWLPPTGRGTREVLSLPTGDIDLIDDAFNANPTSLTASLGILAALAPKPGGRRVAVLGDMLELGPHEAAMHRDIANDPSMAAIDVVHCAGLRMKHLFDALPADKRGQWGETADVLAQSAANLVQPRDIVLIKGSKGSYVSRVVDALRKSGHATPKKNEEG
ncbi:UDP-N-acetylmuramoyl-tripeptide--D-alanyl-D-alanine ligase [Aestuariibius sp. HNIBRBA575]|uniref:UDP-N-acetylmuramoyl-tripeptide--D-alanyl-D- alanine ligase n=1 Tax=Aestuariibius sp. HNIBRBA575 TaxID=3233343 RepID=UPI0034A474CC